MFTELFWPVLLFSLIGGVFSLIGGALLLTSSKSADRLAKYATPFAAGALLAAVFIDLLKEGVEQAEAYTVLLFCLVGVLVFFMAERFLRWFHHHHSGQDEHPHTDANTSLVIVGDTMHNALDGVAIAASFMISIPTGVITTIAVAAHEIPQEIGDFGLLLNKGLSRKKVLGFNILSALATTAAALITLILGSGEAVPVGILLGLSAGFLLYIALSDIIPTIHDEVPDGKLFDIRPLLVLLGVIVVGLGINVAHQYIEAGDHDHDHTSSSVQEPHDHPEE